MSFRPPPASRYATNVDRSRRHPHTIALDMVGPDRRVLELGCAVGSVSAALREQGCRIVGVEIDEEAAVEAKRHCDDVIVGDIEALDIEQLRPHAPFDVVLCGDVLEHLKDPGLVLRRVRPLLAPGGWVVASIPNIAHGSVRLSLLRGRFDYTPSGLLDVTHLRFFTATSVERLFDEAGYVITDFERFEADVLEGDIAVDPSLYSPELLAELRADPDAMTYSFLVRAVAADAYQFVRGQCAREQALTREVEELRRQVELLENSLSTVQARWDRLERRLLVRAYRKLRELRHLE